MTLIIKIFQPDIKTRLEEMERMNSYDDSEVHTFTSTSNEVTNDKETEHSLRNSLRRVDTSKSKENRNSAITNSSVDQFDENGDIIPYIDLKSEFEILMENESSKNMLNEIEDEFDKLEQLISEDSTC